MPSLHYRNVNRIREEREGESRKEEGKKTNAVMSVRPTPIQYICSRLELSLHTTAADDCSDPTHTHTHSSYTHTHHTTLTEALKLRTVLGDATGWQPLTTFSRSGHTVPV
ncbi:hypothetical protein PFLUV_G00117200 [Perca fluviatilis]|uniref:Uncharacterized protein n=1 Tax=Perca fluviatilis TaxID=8168 RepID=A0A6A5F0V4_PERFL|nr:hypothetical protein PFLUV_G00117200 [Perca fluviatilis]